ncbi:hypothetical protein [Fluviicola taffensis]|uniref:DUF2147 domain-containing protein n=1 Tax=Fluviicola taffensis (strain DSM 16823 / NCIMB 13979 / RW262) TaxID=755732 RepID=F2IF37_FLUTR|nr:hypothetical protein [Fluviicola taffensis]AEA43511.1 hypothetical protein Fluta_1518 [Fluviicola taffensis DSM 16823]
MTGKWTGIYQHESKRIPENRRNQQTRFKIEITQFDGKNFSGTIEDDLETGGTRGTGIIEGKIKGNQLRFIKKMPIQTSLDKNGNIIEEQKPHRSIFYTGIIQNDTVKGLWRFKFGIGIFQGKFAIFPSIKGSWEMTKEPIQNL